MRWAGSVYGGRFGSRLGKSHFADGRFAYVDDRREFARAHQRQERGAICGAFFAFQHRDAKVENIGEHLTPECASCAAAGNSNRIYRHAHIPDNLQAIQLAVGKLLP